MPLIEQFDNLFKLLQSQPLGTVQEMLSLGSHFMPTLDVCLRLVKEKMPKKNASELNQQILMPLKNAIKEFASACETVQIKPFINEDIV